MESSFFIGVMLGNGESAQAIRMMDRWWALGLDRRLNKRDTWLKRQLVGKRDHMGISGFQLQRSQWRQRRKRTRELHDLVSLLTTSRAIEIKRLRNASRFVMGCHHVRLSNMASLMADQVPPSLGIADHRIALTTLVVMGAS
jgi:hypothetical protein